MKKTTQCQEGGMKGRKICFYVASLKAKGKNKNEDALQRAIDDAVNNYPNGEYMMNVRVYVSASGKKVKVVGDVWGRDTIR